MSPSLCMPSYFLVICRPVAMETLLSHWLFLHRLSYQFLTDCVAVKYVNCKDSSKTANVVLSIHFVSYSMRAPAHTGWAKKVSLGRFGKKTIVTFSRTFEVKQSINIPPHLKRVATLPTEIAY